MELSIRFKTTKGERRIPLTIPDDEHLQTMELWLEVTRDSAITDLSIYSE